MAGRVSQPCGQVRLTNVATVRLRVGSARYEVAAYPNCIAAWRSGAYGDGSGGGDADLREVLHTVDVFRSVGEGVLASRRDLEEAFGSADRAAAARAILARGELQTGPLERAARLAALRADVAAVVAARCIDPATRRPHPPALVERALRDAGFSLAPRRSAKEQAGRALAALVAHGELPIQRARMRVRVTVAEGGEFSALRGAASAAAAPHTARTQLSTRRRAAAHAARRRASLLLRGAATATPTHGRPIMGAAHDTAPTRAA